MTKIHRRVPIVFSVVFFCCISFDTYAKEKSFEKRLYSAIKSSDFEGTTVILESYFLSQDLSVSPDLYWYKDSPFALYNYYNNVYHRPIITVSAFPADSQTKQYWNTWSKHLTQSKWKPDDFFSNEKEAKALAQYNVLMLMSHELGHHLAQRHSVKYENLNCNEYIADMASMCLIASFSPKSKLARLQNRYLALLKSINNAVEDSEQFTIVNRDIHQNCDCISVQYPKDSSQMAQYASAYFVRRAMLGANTNFQSVSAIRDSIFKINQHHWEQKYPRMLSTLTAVKETKNPVRMGELGKTEYLLNAMDRWHDDVDNVHNIGKVGFSDSGDIYYVRFDWPERMIKGGLQNVHLFDENGNYYFTWHYYPESTEIIPRLKFMGFVGSDLRKDFAFLTFEEDTSDVGRYCLYTQHDGFFLQKQILGIKENLHGTGDCRLTTSSNGVTINSNGYNQFTQTVYSVETGLYNIDTLFQLGLTYSGTSKYEDRLCASSSGDYTAFYSDNYIMIWDGKKLQTLAGTGVEGTNVFGEANNELQQVQAIDLRNGQLTVYDENFSSKFERNPVRVLKYKVELSTND